MKNVNSFFAGALIILSGCQALRLPNPTESHLDQEFRIRRAQSAFAGEAVTQYRTYISPTLSSHCKWSPSDSQYAVIAQNKCGSVTGGLMAFSRFLNEEDAVRMGVHIVEEQKRLKYADLPSHCWL